MVQGEAPNVKHFAYLTVNLDCNSHVNVLNMRKSRSGLLYLQVLMERVPLIPWIRHCCM